MISKNQIKLIQSLKIKKYRHKHRAFVVEGDKMVKELLSIDWKKENEGLVKRIRVVYAVKEWIEQEQVLIDEYPSLQFELISAAELAKISQLQTPNKVLALVDFNDLSMELSLQNSLVQHALVLDHLQDPGNLGTIIRIADWFGIERVYCSNDCVDLFNAKVIQATMGSVFRVKPYYVALEKLMQDAKREGLPIYGAMLGGEVIHKSSFERKGLIVIGNEGAGIRSSIQPYLSHKLSIPRLGKAESLNAAVATGIICAIACL